MTPDDLVVALQREEVQTRRRVQRALRDAGDALAVQAGSSALRTTPGAGRTDARVVASGDSVTVKISGPGSAPGVDVTGLERLVGRKIEEAGR